MDTNVIVSLVILLLAVIIYIMYNIFRSKQSNSPIDIDDLLSKFLIDIIRITQSAIEILAIDPNDYSDEETYKKELARYVSEELYIIISNSSISETIKKMLTKDILIDFIIKSYDIIGDISGTDKEIMKIRSSK